MVSWFGKLAPSTRDFNGNKPLPRMRQRMEWGGGDFQLFEQANG